MLQTLMILALGAPPGPWGEFQLGGAGSYGTGIGLEEATGAASVALSGFLHHRLVEDDAPLSLQPYLQRAGAIEGSFSYDHFVTDRVELSGPYRIDTVGGAVSLDAYPGGLFSLWISASFFHVQDGGGNNGWQSIVFAERVYLSLLGELILSGGRGSLEVSVFPARSVGLHAALEYAEGAIYYWGHDVFRQWQPTAGLSWWITPSVGLRLEYRFIHSELVDDDPPGLNTINTHRVALTFRSRLG